jgi:4-carboxymuconolactone decarboxylase
MGRLPPLDPTALSGAQKALYDKIKSGPRGRVGGPMEAMVLCPVAGEPLQELGARLRFDGVLPGKLRELAILVAARFWSAQFEWYAHARIAREEGLDDSVIADIAEGTPPVLASPEETVVYTFCCELHEAHAIGDETFAKAVDVLGREAVIELTMLAGYYTAVSMILNTFEVPLPDGVTPPLQPLSRY